MRCRCQMCVFCLILGYSYNLTDCAGSRSVWRLEDPRRSQESGGLHGLMYCASEREFCGLLNFGWVLDRPDNREQMSVQSPSEGEKDGSIPWRCIKVNPEVNWWLYNSQAKYSRSFVLCNGIMHEIWKCVHDLLLNCCDLLLPEWRENEEELMKKSTLYGIAKWC